MSLEGCEIIEILNASVPLAASGLSSSFSQAAAEAWTFLAPGFYLVLGPEARSKARQRFAIPRLVGPLPSRIAAEALRITAYALNITAPRRQGVPAGPEVPAVPLAPPRASPWRLAMSRA